MTVVELKSLIVSYEEILFRLIFVLNNASVDKNQLLLSTFAAVYLGPTSRLYDRPVPFIHDSKSITAKINLYTITGTRLHNYTLSEIPN